jgi:hypothetical protein
MADGRLTPAGARRCRKEVISSMGETRGLAPGGSLASAAGEDMTPEDGEPVEK